MKWCFTLLATVLAAGWLLAQPPTTPNHGRIVVKIDGFKSDDGQVRVYLFDDPKAFPSKKDRAIKVVKQPIHDRQAEIIFDEIPYGTYAVSVHHDVNGNDKIDHNWMHIPKEPYGSSNGARGKFGPPKFKKAKFDHAGVLTTIPVTVK